MGYCTVYCIMLQGESDDGMMEAEGAASDVEDERDGMVDADHFTTLKTHDVRC